MDKSIFCNSILCGILLLLSGSSCKKQEFSSKNILWKSNAYFSGVTEVYCDGVYISSETIDAPVQQGNLTFYKDGTGKNDSLSIIESPSFTWRSNGDTLIISSLAEMELVYLLSDSLDSRSKKYDAYLFVSPDVPCLIDYSKSNSYLIIDF